MSWARVLVLQADKPILLEGFDDVSHMLVGQF